MEESEEKVIELLTLNTKQEVRNTDELFDIYKDWVNGLNHEELKGVIRGCASFRYDNSRVLLISKDKLAKIDSEYKKQVSQIYLDYAKDVFYCSV